MLCGQAATRAPDTLVPNRFSPTCSRLCADSQKLVNAVIAAGYVCACTVRLCELLQHWVLLPAAAAMCVHDYEGMSHFALPCGARVNAKLWACRLTLPLASMALLVSVRTDGAVLNIWLSGKVD